jgi:hypothetical protein
MPTERTADATRPQTLRARVTNGTKLLEGVDGRRATARLGDDLSPAEHLLVRLAATTFLRVETLQAAVAKRRDGGSMSRSKGGRVGIPP